MQLLSIHNSTSWKITMPIRVLGRTVRQQTTLGEVTNITWGKLRRFVHIRIISTIKWAGDRAKRSPTFKRFAMNLLRKHPGLQQKLRWIYLVNQFNDQPQMANWPGTSTDAVTPLSVGIQDDRECIIPLPYPRGINANQRSPLEVNFNTYREPR
jgi:hypothetical protein